MNSIDYKRIQKGQPDGQVDWTTNFSSQVSTGASKSSAVAFWWPGAGPRSRHLRQRLVANVMVCLGSIVMADKQLLATCGVPKPCSHQPATCFHSTLLPLGFCWLLIICDYLYHTQRTLGCSTVLQPFNHIQQNKSNPAPSVGYCSPRCV